MADGPDLADISDVTARSLRTLSATELSVAGAYIPDASAILRAAVPGLDALIAAGTVSANLVTAVIARMILRAIESQVPVTSRTDTVGGVAAAVTYATGYTPGLLQVFPEDLVGIKIIPTISGMGTIQTPPAVILPPDPYNQWRYSYDGWGDGWIPLANG